MLLPIFHDNDAMELLAFFISELRNGMLPKMLKPYVAKYLAVTRGNCEGAATD